MIRKSTVMQYFMVGGFSLIAFYFIKIVGAQTVDSSTSWFIYYFSFVVNFPHFLSSYHLLYGDFRQRLFSNYRYWLASVISPAVLIGFLFYGLFVPDIDILALILNSMYFFVGWHYVKQTFGVLSVCNSQYRITYNKTERFGIKGFLYSIWAVSWVSLNTAGAQYAMEGIPFKSLALPPILSTTAFGFLLCFGVYNLFLGYEKYIRDGKVISMGGLISIAALLVWYIPALYNPTYFLLVPMFHSLQYLYFVYLVKSNQANSLAPERNTPEQRKIYFNKLYIYLSLPFLTGAIFMWHLPKLLDSQINMTASFPGAQPFMFAFTVFINIHHYFIDHAIWRHDNPTMRSYLFVPTAD